MNTTANANLFSRLFDGLDDPKRLAIETHDGERITYGDLIARAGQIANVLVERGVKPGDRVAAQTEKSVAGLVLYLATVRAGAIYLPLNTAYTLNELDYFITDAEPSLVVCDPSKADGIKAIAAKVKAKVETLGFPRQGLADGRRRQGESRISRRLRAATTISPRSSTPRAPPAAPRARCCPTTISPRTRCPWSTTGASPTRTC